MRITEDSGKGRLHLCEICGHRFKLKCDFSRHRIIVCKTAQQNIITSKSLPTQFQKDSQLSALTPDHKGLPVLAQLPVLTPMNTEPQVSIPLVKKLPVLTPVGAKLSELTAVKQKLLDNTTESKNTNEPIECPPVATNVPVLFPINMNIPVLTLISEVLDNFSALDNPATSNYKN